MLIYEWSDGQLLVTQITKGFIGDAVSTHKTDIERIYKGHQKAVKYLEGGFVFVTGDTSKAGNGYKLRKDYEHYLDYQKEIK